MADENTNLTQETGEITTLEVHVDTKDSAVVETKETPVTEAQPAVFISEELANMRKEIEELTKKLSEKENTSTENTPAGENKQETPAETKEVLDNKANDYLKEIEEMKKEMAKLKKANEFTSTENSNSQNKATSGYSDEDILHFRWKI